MFIHILEATCWQVFAVRERANQRSGKKCINSLCKEEVIGHVSLIASMFLSLPHCALGIFATGKLVNHGVEYGLEILVNFHFYGPEKAM